MRKKVCIFLVFLMVFSTLLASCATKKKTTEKKETKKEKETKEATGTPYLIGVILSLTGDYSSLGVPEKNVIEMEVDKFNKEGGVNGHPVEVTIEDDGTDATKAVTAATKLIEQDKVMAIVGTSGTGQTMAIRGEIEKAQIPNVSLAGGNAISEPVNKWVFQVPWPNGVVVPKTLDYLKKKKITKIGLLYDSGGFGVDGQKVLEQKVGEYDIEIVASESYGKDDTDMTVQLTKIKGEGAEAVVVWGAGKAPSIIAKNMDQLGMDIPYIGSHGIARKEFVDGAGDSAEGVVFAAGKIIVPDAYGKGTEAFELADEYIQDYTDQYGEEPNGTFPAHAYDGIHIVFDALKRLDKLPDKVDPKELRDAIEKTKGLILTGGSFTYSATDHFGTKPTDLVMIEVKDGKFEEIE